MEIRYAHPDVQAFIDSLDTMARAKLVRHSELLKEQGKSLGMPFSKYVGRSMYELRIIGVQNVRIFYAFHAQYIWFLLGISKKSQKLSIRDMQTALRRLATLRSA
jgi:phage-related protein